MRATWAKEEMATAHLSDARLDTRMELILSRVGRAPQLSIPAACPGRAEMEATYCFFGYEKVTLQVLEPRGRATRQRLAQHAEVLLPQDTTEIELTRPETEVAGAGPLDGTRRGFLLHAMQFSTRGSPVGHGGGGDPQSDRADRSRHPGPESVREGRSLALEPELGGTEQKEYLRRLKPRLEFFDKPLTSACVLIRPNLWLCYAPLGPAFDPITRSGEVREAIPVVVQLPTPPHEPRATPLISWCSVRHGLLVWGQF